MQYRKSNYVRVVCYIISQKTEIRRKILTVGGNLIHYPGDFSTLTSGLTTIKLHVNSAISDFKSRYMYMEVMDFYLNNMMDRAYYIIIQISIDSVIDSYEKQEFLID